MNEFRSSLEVKHDLLDPEICKGKNYWGCIAENLGIDHRIIANTTAREEIERYLKAIVRFNGAGKIAEKLKEEGNGNCTDFQIRERLNRNTPSDTNYILKNIKLLTQEDYERKRKAYGLNISETTGGIIIEILDKSNLNFKTIIKFSVNQEGNVVRSQTRLIRKTDGKISAKRTETIIDQYGVVQQVSTENFADYTLNESNEPNETCTFTRVKNYPFAVRRVWKKREGGEEQASTEIMAINIYRLNEINNVIDSYENGESFQATKINDEDEMKKYFENNKEKFSRITNKGIRKLFIKAGLLRGEKDYS